MSAPSGATAAAVSPDSEQVWTAEGPWPVADGVHRIPLPLPMDGLRAVNVYVLTSDEGLTLVDGGWAIPQGRDALQRSLRRLGAEFGDIARILVTHVHRDHYTLAAWLGTEFGAQVALGAAEKPVLDLAHRGPGDVVTAFRRGLERLGAPELARAWSAFEHERPDPGWWRDPDLWLHDGDEIPVDGRTLTTIHTPGHTPGHVVLADLTAGSMYTGDHVLPTITPSIGFTEPVQPDPLGDFLASLHRMLDLPDLTMLPAHGPVGMSTHERAQQLLDHHERRLASTLQALDPRHATAFQVAGRLTWTRHQRAFADLHTFDQVLAVRETQAHLTVLADRGLAKPEPDANGVARFARM